MMFFLQGGSDWLADAVQSSKMTDKLKGAIEEELTAQQKATAKALYTLKNISPDKACLIAKRFNSIGGIIRHFLSQPEAQANAAIADLRRENGQRVGPAAAAKLRRLLLSRDPTEEYVETDT